MAGLMEISLQGGTDPGEDKDEDSDDDLERMMQGFALQDSDNSIELQNIGIGTGTSAFSKEEKQAPHHKQHKTTSLPSKSFCGLNNQGATCYMNSLLQTLFMTPEFRNALFKWKHDPVRDDAKVDCIPYQLQTLFAQMALGNHTSIGTKPLTRSFGWDDSQGFVQNDVNELCRVLFDVCEKCFQGTENEHLIQTLYEGKYFEYLRLKPPSNAVRGQIAKFSDLALVIKPFGSEQSNGSVSKMLNHFTNPELLDGDNKVLDEKLNIKVEAYKGTQMTKLPYVLTLAFKRFEFDFATLRRSKVNDRVEFPYVIDMNDWCHSPWKQEWHHVFGETYQQCSTALMLIVVRKKQKWGEGSNTSADSGSSRIINCILSMTHKGWFDTEEISLKANNTEEGKEGKKGNKAEGNEGNKGNTTNGDSKENDGKGNPFAAALDEEENGLPPLVDYFGRSVVEDDAHNNNNNNNNNNSNNLDQKNKEHGENTTTTPPNFDRLSSPDYGMDIDDATEEYLDRLRQMKGPYIYELFSVIVHVGTVTSGHYYAYIKDLGDTRRWYKFNDATVTPINDADVIASAFGGGGTSHGSSGGSSSSSASSFPGSKTRNDSFMSRHYGHSGTGSYGTRSGRNNKSGYSSTTSSKTYRFKSASNSNAYQVTYRRYEPIRNQSFVDTNANDLPKHLLAQMKEVEEAKQKEKLLKEAKRQAIKCNGYYFSDGRYNNSSHTCPSSLEKRRLAATKASKGTELNEVEVSIEPLEVQLMKTMTLNDIKYSIGTAWGLNVEKEQVEGEGLEKEGEQQQESDRSSKKVEEEVVLLKDLRLWEWRTMGNCPVKPLELDRNKKSVSYLTRYPNNIYATTKYILLERKRPDETFIPYDDESMHVFVTLHVPAVNGTGAGAGAGPDTGPDTGNVRDANQVTATTTINSFKDILPRPTPPSPTSIINTTPATEKAEKEHDNTDWDEDEEEEEEEEEKALLGTFTEPYPLIIADTCLLHDVLPKIASLYSINTQTHDIRIMSIQKAYMADEPTITVLHNENRAYGTVKVVKHGDTLYVEAVPRPVQELDTTKIAALTDNNENENNSSPPPATEFVDVDLNNTDSTENQDPPPPSLVPLSPPPPPPPPSPPLVPPPPLAPSPCAAVKYARNVNLPKDISVAATQSQCVALVLSYEFSIDVAFNKIGASASTESVTIDNRKDVKALKKKISKILKLKTSEFKLKRSSYAYGVGLREDDKLKYITKVHVELGRALKAGEFNLKVGLVTSTAYRHPESLCIVGCGWSSSNSTGHGDPLLQRIMSYCSSAWFVNHDDHTTEMTCEDSLHRSAAGYDFTIGNASSFSLKSNHINVFEVPFNGSKDINLLRKTIGKKLKTNGMLPQDASVECIRLGGVNASTGTFQPIFKDGQSLKDQTHSLYNGFSIGVEILKTPEQLNVTSILLRVVHWDRQSWTCGRPVEVVWPPPSRREMKALPVYQERERSEKESEEENKSTTNVENEWGNNDKERLQNYLGHCCGWTVDQIKHMELRRFSSYQPYNFKDLDSGTSSGYFSAYSNFSSGDRFVFYDKTVPLKSLTEKEKSLLRYKPARATTAHSASVPGFNSASSSSASSSSSSYSPSYTYKKRTEKGVSIKTKKQRDQEAKENKEKEKEKETEELSYTYNAAMNMITNDDEVDILDVD